MACGLPVVATRVGANGELVDAGATGSLVAPASSDALAGAIVAYFADVALATKHGTSARLRAVSHFSLERMVDRYDRLYRRLLAPQPRPAAPIARASGHKHPNHG
jgi:glycosyltransferase involved in cell wall biosynthesis